MSVVFKNPDVAAEFEALRSADGKVHVPSGRSIPGKKKVGYSGLLSGITKEAAEKLLESNSNLIKRKEKPAKPSLPKAAENGSSPKEKDK